VRRALPVLIIGLAAAAPAAAQTAPKMSADLQKVGMGDRDVTLRGKTFRVRGSVTPFVAGQRVRIRVFRGKQLLSEKTKPITQAGDAGQFVADFKAKFSGPLRVGVTHVRTPEMGYAHTRTGPLHVIGTSYSPGQRGYSVRVLQRLLRDGGYVVGERGLLDSRTLRAVHAFRKLSGLPRTFSVSRTVLRRLINGGGRFEVRYPELGHHVEADLTHQVLALIDNGKVQRIYPISSGKPSTPTVLGRWRVYYKLRGLSSKRLVHPSFFTGGYAIHGWPDVPPYPASHGCLRVPIPDALSIFKWIRMGDWVSTYYRGGGKRSVKRIANPGP
jgi:hypothetical protein